eukprot:TRINITY_DN4064_c0_g1_i2.p1 TRINITY_DN4064_c0_g1~~TRINITY_DN4064_c0_g1_i2.p1  ORF type:complete len:332 (-),score=80.04 TRINITY_DN4064_c0_g1_i2:29-1024(-)
MSGMSPVSWVRFVFSSASMAGSAFVIVTFTILPSLRKSFPRTAFFMSIPALILSFIGIFTATLPSSVTTSPEVCIALSLFTQYFALVAGLWSFIICIKVTLVLQKVPVKDIRKKSVYFHLVSWLVPLAFVGVGITYGLLHDVSCWIDGGVWGVMSAPETAAPPGDVHNIKADPQTIHAMEIYELMFVYLPCMTMVVVEFFLLLFLGLRFCKMPSFNAPIDIYAVKPNANRKKIFLRVLPYPLAYAVCVTPSFIFHVIEVLDKESIQSGMIVYTEEMIWLVGFVGFLAYLCTPNLRKEYRVWWRLWWNADHTRTDAYGTPAHGTNYDYKTFG